MIYGNGLAPVGDTVWVGGMIVGEGVSVGVGVSGVAEGASVKVGRPASWVATAASNLGGRIDGRGFFRLYAAGK